MKRIAIVTGASSGMGHCFAETAAEHVAYDELWVIARREERLQQIKEKLKGQTVVPIAMDLAVKENIQSLGERLKKEDAEVVLLVNAAGFGNGELRKQIGIPIVLCAHCRMLMIAVMNMVDIASACVEAHRLFREQARTNEHINHVASPGCARNLALIRRALKRKLP